MKLYKKIAITTGDKDGIGFEVAAKALSQLQSSIKKNRALFFIFRHKTHEKTQPQFFKLIDKTWSRLTFDSLDKALAFLANTQKSLPDNLLIDLSLVISEAEWVVQAARACGQKKLTSLVTGPLSKKISTRLPQKPLGHTGIFRQIFPAANLFMAFVGKDFNVMLATDHIPLCEAEARLKKRGLADALKAAEQLQGLLKSKKKIAVLGFNPHAGEGGLIGNLEKTLFARLPSNTIGPLVPDAAFLKKNWKLYSVFVCLYHDQGLIPFKMQHGQDSGAHLTLGLAFVRTSVDHGTAIDLFNKNIANPNSMLEAIKLNIQLIGD